MESSSNYYLQLEKEQKKLFLKRIQLFLRFIRFESSSDLPVSEEMKVVIAAAAIQLTFGLRRFIFAYYTKILVRAGIYIIPEFPDRLVGHVDKSRRTITLSWPNTQFGFKVPDDAHNVALHEMAHVILFENTLRLRFNEFFSRPHWDYWMSHAEKQFMINQKRKNVLLAEYADRDLVEMFAVSVETFFEQPDKFKSALPELYKALVLLLKQDPGKKANPRSFEL